MEPANLSHSFHEDEDLKVLFQVQAPALPDDGFSQRVLSALPAPHRQSPAFQIWLWIAGAFMGSLVAAFKGASWSSFVTGMTPAFSMVLGAVMDPWLALALALTGASLLMTYFINRRTARSF